MKTTLTTTNPLHIRTGGKMTILPASGDGGTEVIVESIQGSTVTFRNVRWTDHFRFAYERIAGWFEDRFPEWISVW